MYIDHATTSKQELRRLRLETRLLLQRVITATHQTNWPRPRPFVRQLVSFLHRRVEIARVKVIARVVQIAQTRRLGTLLGGLVLDRCPCRNCPCLTRGRCVLHQRAIQRTVESGRGQR